MGNVSGGKGKDDDREITDALFESIEKTLRGLRVVFRGEMQRLGITFPQLHLLKIVREHGTLTVTEISSLMMIAPPTASRMIDSLCDKGLLLKRADSNDRRLARVTLTEKSSKILESMRENQRNMTSAILQGEDPSELEACVKALSRLADKWVDLAEKQEEDGWMKR